LVSDFDQRGFDVWMLYTQLQSLKNECLEGTLLLMKDQHFQAPFKLSQEQKLRQLLRAYITRLPLFLENSGLGRSGPQKHSTCPSNAVLILPEFSDM